MTKVNSINQEISNNIKQFTNQLSNSSSQSKDNEMKWLLANCNDDDVKMILPRLTVLMLHVIEAIHNDGPVNCARISEQTLIPKGTVSKISKKLITLELISLSYLENNKKERLYQVTALGKKVALLHDDLHQYMENKMRTFLGQYQTSELEVLNSFFNEFKKLYL